MLRLGLNEANSETKEVSTLAKAGIAFVCLWATGLIFQVGSFTLIYFFPDGARVIVLLGGFAFLILMSILYYTWVDRLEAIEEAGGRCLYSVSIILTFIAALIIWGVVRGLAAG